MESNTRWLIFGICGWLGMVAVVGLIGWGVWQTADYVLTHL